MSRRKKHPKRRPAVVHHRRCPHHPDHWKRVAPLDRKHVECTCAWDRARDAA